MTIKLVIIIMIFFLTVFKLSRENIDGLSLIANYGGRKGSSLGINLLCPITGYRCPNANCDCKAICGSDEYERVTVDEKNNYVVSVVQQHEPGTYCLPRGLDRFLTFNADLVYTTKGWSVVSKMPHIWNDRGQMVACASPFAKDNALNYLFDEKEGRKVTLQDDLSDLNEKLPTGKPRYRCHCRSRDLQDNKMVSYYAFPFTCMTDHCKNNIPAAGFRGWNGKACDCGPRNVNRDPLDPKSPCVIKPVQQQSPHDYVFTAKCTTKSSLFSQNGFYCPDKFDSDHAGFVYFSKKMVFDKTDPYDILVEISGELTT